MFHFSHATVLVRLWGDSKNRSRGVRMMQIPQRPAFMQDLPSEFHCFLLSESDLDVCVVGGDRSVSLNHKKEPSLMRVVLIQNITVVISPPPLPTISASAYTISSV